MWPRCVYGCGCCGGCGGCVVGGGGMSTHQTCEQPQRSGAHLRHHIIIHGPHDGRVRLRSNLVFPGVLPATKSAVAIATCATAAAGSALKLACCSLHTVAAADVPTMSAAARTISATAAPTAVQRPPLWPLCRIGQRQPCCQTGGDHAVVLCGVSPVQTHFLWLLKAHQQRR